MNRFLVIVTALLLLGMAAPAAADNGGRPLHANLSSANEVPPVDTGGSGTASITLNQGQGEICVDIATEELAGAVVAGHIHAGEAGVNGGVVVNLGVNSADFAACIDGIAADVIKDIRQNPQNYYINIHTLAVPSGEVRGQLSK